MSYSFDLRERCAFTVDVRIRSRVRSFRLACDAGIAVAALTMLAAPSAWAGCTTACAGPEQASTEVGVNAHAGPFATVIGYGADNHRVMGAISIGTGAGGAGSGRYSTAIGTSDLFAGVLALGTYSIAIGSGDSNSSAEGARAEGTSSVAIGTNSQATGSGFASAYGYNARANVGLGPIAVGTDALATGTNAAAFGRFGAATADDSTALGAVAGATGIGSVAVGAYAQATATSSLAIGRKARATRLRAVAIGTGSIADAADTVSVGQETLPRRITNVAPAVKPNDAVTLSQVRTLIAGAVRASSAGLASASDSHGISVMRVDTASSNSGNDSLRQRIAELEVMMRQQQALVQQQQQRIAELESRALAARE